MTFSKGKRGERQTGREGEGREREKAVPSAESKAVLQIQTHLCYKTKWKGQECGPCLPNENKIAPFLFFTICTKHIAS